ncbi:MAG: transporter [Fidelibacterota bacterium]
MSQFFIPILIVPLMLGAQTDLPELVTDRPDQTESASVVSPGWIQVETGILYERETFRKGGFTSRTRTLSYPTTLVRIGLIRPLELRLTGQWTMETTTSNPSPFVISGGEKTTQGISGVGVGGKFRVTSQREWIPETAVVAHLEPAAPASEGGERGWVSRLLLATGHDVSDRLGLSWNIGGEWWSEGSGGSLLYTLALGGDLTRNLGGFVEVFGDVSRQSGTTLQFDAGLTHLVGSNLQLDASAGFGTAGDTPGWFLSAGLSYRFRR